MEIEELEELITEINSTINRVARFDGNNQEIATTSSKIIGDIVNSLEKRNTIKLTFRFSDNAGFNINLLILLLIILIVLISIYTIKKQISDKEKDFDKKEKEIHKETEK